MSAQENKDIQVPAEEPAVSGIDGREQGALRKIFAAAASVFCGALSVVFLLTLVIGSGSHASGPKVTAQEGAIMDKYDMFMTNEISGALDGVLSIEKVYWLSDSDLVAPKPNPACYGEAQKPEELTWLLEKAKDLIGDQTMLFGENTPVWEGDKIYYYYDETILVITWKEIREKSIYTFSEVKVAHPSQFRRFLSGGEYGSDKRDTTTNMAQSVNAVVASSGDFYGYRHFGAIVHDGELKRFEGHSVDTCFITEEGDLVFAYRDQLKTEEDARKFAEENNARFSLAFGPVLVDDGKAVTTNSYIVGEIDKEYSRAAICQMDDLHYLLVNCCGEPGYPLRQRMNVFAKYIAETGCQKAYALDGGQTTVIAMDGKMVSAVDFGTQRQISDIIYFATAMPSGG